MSQDSVSVRSGLTRLTQFVLGMDGVLHFVEVFAAYAERAWLTMLLTSIHAFFFLAAVYFIGHDHSHHHGHDHSEGSEPPLWKKMLFAFILVAVVIALSPLDVLA